MILFFPKSCVNDFFSYTYVDKGWETRGSGIAKGLNWSRLTLRRCASGDCSEWITGNRIHWYYERQGVRYTLVYHRNERHEQKRACKFDRYIFVAMVEQSRDSVARLNVMNDLSWIHCRSDCRFILALLALKRIAIQLRSDRIALYFFVLLYLYVLYIRSLAILNASWIFFDKFVLSGQITTIFIFTYLK